MNERINLTETQKDYAVYLPAVSGFYVDVLAKIDADPDYYGKDRLPASFITGAEGLNHLDQHKGLFHYKWGLYSAGHAELDLSKAATTERMIHGRDRKHNVLLGDSSGFQALKGVGLFKNVNWDDFKGPTWDNIRSKILNWLENTAEYSLTLDIPSWSCMPPYSAKTGLTEFSQTLDYTVFNLDYFVKNRIPGKTKFLNVISGIDINSSREWYEAVIPFSKPEKVKEMGYDENRTLECIALAGCNKQYMPATLKRLADLIEDGIIPRCEWIHCLGLARLDWALYFTSIQRLLREHYNPNITISFDAASPYLSVAKGLVYSQNIFMPKRWGYNMEAAIDERTAKGSTAPMPFSSPITDRLTVGDICRLGPGEPNRLGKVAKTSWDNMSYALLMGHNVYKHITAVQEANRIRDYENLRVSANYRDWTKSKRTASQEISEYVPSNILFFDSFIKEYLDPSKTHADRYAMVDDNLAFLETISFGDTKMNVMTTLFDFNATGEVDTSNDLAEDTDDELDSLKETN